MFLSVLKKRIYIFILSLWVVLCIAFIFSACKPNPDRIFSVGNEWTNGDISIKLVSLDYKKNDDMLDIELKFTVNPTFEYIIEEQDAYVYVVAGEPIYADVEESIALNGYDIFDTQITTENTCIFLFQVPISYFCDEDGSVIEGEWAIKAYLKPTTFTLYLDI